MIDSFRFLVAFLLRRHNVRVKKKIFSGSASRINTKQYAQKHFEYMNRRLHFLKGEVESRIEPNTDIVKPVKTNAIANAAKRLEQQQQQQQHQFTATKKIDPFHQPITQMLSVNGKFETTASAPVKRNSNTTATASAGSSSSSQQQQKPAAKASASSATSTLTAPVVVAGTRRQRDDEKVQPSQKPLLLSQPQQQQTPQDPLTIPVLKTVGPKTTTRAEQPKLLQHTSKQASSGPGSIPAVTADDTIKRSYRVLLD